MSSPFDANQVFGGNQDFLARLEAAQKEAEQRAQQRREARLAAGLCETAGTGRPEPQIVFVEIPRDEEFDEDEYQEEEEAELEEELPFDDPTIGQRVNDIWKTLQSGDPADLAKQAPEMLESIGQLKDDLFQDSGFQDVLANCEEMARQDELRRQELIGLGNSRLGGLPDLPESIAWPESRGKLLPFVAQLNLNEIPASPLLPSPGWMYVFAWIGDEGREAGVSFYDGDVSTLRRAPRPPEGQLLKDWTNTDVYTPVALRCLGHDQPAEEEYEACWLQGEMWDVFGTPGEFADYEMKDGEDWINLLAITSAGSMEWSDSGHLYLLIRRSDYEQGNFDNILPAIGSS